MRLIVYAMRFVLVVACLGSPAIGLAQREEKKPDAASRAPLAGEPIAAARRTAIDARSFQRPLDAERISKWMELASKCTIAEFELFLAPLTEDESRLAAKIERMPAPIVNRLRFENLRGVLKNGGLLSLEREQQLLNGQMPHTTPALEEALFGGYDCVFASIGPPDGSPRYGDVIIRLEDSVRDGGWATPTSGMHFMWAVRHKDANKMLQMLSAGKELPASPDSPLSLDFDDRLHFSHQIVTESDWNKALTYQAILVLRNLDDSLPSKRVRDRFDILLVENDPAKFWAAFIPPLEKNLPPEEAAARIPFGYLEGKFDDKLSIDDFISIEVPPERLAEVRSWPEAQPYLELIRAKADGVE